MSKEKARSARIVWMIRRTVLGGAFGGLTSVVLAQNASPAIEASSAGTQTYLLFGVAAGLMIGAIVGNVTISRATAPKPADDPYRL